MGGRDFERAFVMVGCEGAGWIRALTAELETALRHIGLEAALLDFRNMKEAFARSARRRFFCVDVNRFISGYLPAEVPKYSIMVDHPCTRLAEVVKRPTTLELLGWVDATHVTEAAVLGLPVRSTFLAHAGPDAVGSPKPIRDRDIDIFFAGSLAEPVDRAHFLATRRDISEAIANVIFDAVEALQQTREPAIPVFAKACSQRGIDTAALTREMFCRLVSIAQEIAEMNRRNAILEALPDARIVVTSSYLPEKLRARSNLIYLGFVEDFGQIRHLMSRSKIVLNSTSKFPRGAHERIWFGMSEGAALLTDRSAYMESDFRDGAEILYLPPGSVSARDFDAVGGLLADAAALERMVDAARAIYQRKHTWKQRITTLYDGIRAVA